MISRVKKEPRRVVFRVLAPEAAQVSIWGDFNGWAGKKEICDNKFGPRNHVISTWVTMPVALGHRWYVHRLVLSRMPANTCF